MKYTLGYFGNCEFLEDNIIHYCNLPENEKIEFVNISSIDKEHIDANSFNGFIFDTALHKNEITNELIMDIIQENPELDVMPVVIPDLNDETFNSVTALREETDLLKDITECVPYKVQDEEESKLFVDTVLHTFSRKTIRNIEKIEQLQLKSKQDYINALKAIVVTLEFKDVYTMDHSSRVAIYAEQMARKMGLSEREIDNISIGGWVHDIGKLGVNKEILKSTNGKLSDEEFNHIKTHCKIGEYLLNRILPPDDNSKDIISYELHHHAKYDGTGYPENIAGDDIPLGARILCVADSFDAMTTKRTYNKPMTLEESIEQLKRCSGTQFDPKIADVFIELLKQEPEKLKDTLGITIDENRFIQTSIKTTEKDRDASKQKNKNDDIIIE